MTISERKAIIRTDRFGEKIVSLPRITGTIKNIIVNPSKKVRIIVYFKEFPNIILLDEEVGAPTILQPKLQPRADDRRAWSFGTAEYTLKNDIINVKVDGALHSIVDIRVRYL